MNAGCRRKRQVTGFFVAMVLRRAALHGARSPSLVRRIPVYGGAGKGAKVVERAATLGDKAYGVLDRSQGAP